MLSLVMCKWDSGQTLSKQAVTTGRELMKNTQGITKVRWEENIMLLDNAEDAFTKQLKATDDDEDIAPRV